MRACLEMDVGQNVMQNQVSSSRKTTIQEIPPNGATFHVYGIEQMTSEPVEENISMNGWWNA